MEQIKTSSQNIGKNQQNTFQQKTHHITHKNSRTLMNYLEMIIQNVQVQVVTFPTHDSLIAQHAAGLFLAGWGAGGLPYRSHR